MNDLPNVVGELPTPPDRERLELGEPTTHPPRIMLLYGSSREHPFSRVHRRATRGRAGRACYHARILFRTGSAIGDVATERA